MGTSCVHVTLVHGTFARRARWTQPGSAMAEGLVRAGMTYESFHWSGRNSHRARIEAAKQLAHRLREQHSEKPEVRRAVVAHSHGGNIAVHAVWRIMEERGGSISLVTLATPFFFVGRRPSTGIARQLFLFVGVALLLGLSVTLPLWSWRWNGPVWMLVLYWTLWFVLALQALAAGYWYIVHGPPWRKSNQNRFMEAVHTPEGQGAKLLIVRAADDEAGAFLATSQFGGWAAMAALRLMKPSVWIKAFSFLFAGTAGIAWALRSSDPEALAVAVSSTFLIVVTWLSVGLFSVIALSNLGHGLDGPTASLFAFVSAEATPPGEYRVKQRIVREPTERGLSHSSVYDEEVVGWVVKHISGSTSQKAK